MLRVWGSLHDAKRIVADAVIENEELARPEQERVDACIAELVKRFDLATPIWLKINHEDMERFGRTSFRAENFIENFPYKSFDIEIIERDEE